MEIYKEIDTSTAEKSGRITFVWIVMGDNLESPDRSGHQGVWEAGMQLASEKSFSCAA